MATPAEEAERLRKLLSANELQFTSAFDKAKETAAEKERKQTSWVRSTLAIVIIAIYAVAVGVAVLYVLLRFPECSGLAIFTCEVQQTGWKAQSEVLMGLLTGAVLPVVTLMLGFYFGTETAQKGGDQ